MARKAKSSAGVFVDMVSVVRRYGIGLIVLMCKLGDCVEEWEDMGALKEERWAD